jgi:hypothetical protein
MKTFDRRRATTSAVRRTLSVRSKQIAERHQRNLSIIATRTWNDMNDDERAPFAELSEREKEEHRRLYPGYSFKPGRRQIVKAAMNTPPVARRGEAPREPSLPPAPNHVPVFDVLQHRRAEGFDLSLKGTTGPKLGNARYMT